MVLVLTFRDFARLVEIFEVLFTTVYSPHGQVAYGEEFEFLVESNSIVLV